MSRPAEEVGAPRPETRQSRWSLLLALGSGALLAMAHFAPIASPVVLIGGLLMLWNAAARERRYRVGYLFALAYFLPLTHWLGHFVGRFTETPLLGLFVWLLVSVLLSLPLALIVPIAHRSFAGDRAWIVPLAWLVLELFRSYVPVFAFPWGLLAHPIYPWVRFSNLAPYMTEFGYGAALVGLSVAIFRWSAMGKWIRLGNATVFGLLILAGVGRTSLLHARETAKKAMEQDKRLPPVVFGAYQPGIDLAYGDPSLTSFQVQSAIAEARTRAQGASVDVVVLPEGLLSIHSPADFPPLFGEGVLVTGGQRHQGRSAYQTAFAFDGRWHWADKTRLVIFGEFVPGRGVIPYPESFHLPGGDLAAGEDLQTLDVRTRYRTVRLGPILCFEALFPDIALRQREAGAEVLTVMSLDDWFGDTKAPEWLADAARWRAMETDRLVVRAGAMGLTRIINPDGSIAKSLPWGERGLIQSD